MNKPTLLILAAGMGSRYGGLKQMDEFGPSGEKIIDYSIYDAIRAGFGKVVFVIRKSFEEPFAETFVKPLKDKIQVEYVFQELDSLPEGLTAPSERVKPWGTGHAVLVAAPKIHEPFAVINADDFYGPEAYKTIAQYLSSPDSVGYCMVGYQLENTLSDYGSVSRGICQVDEGGYLESIIERTKIRRLEDGSIVFEENGQQTTLQPDDVASMNLMGFPASAFQYFEEYFKEFFEERSEDLKAEFYLPFVMNKVIRKGHAQAKVLNTSAKWFGVTYKEDKEMAVERLKGLVEAGVYSNKLWE